VQLRRTMLGAGLPPARLHHLRYLDNQGQPDGQTEACDTHARELSAELRVIDRRRRDDGKKS
jgi:hypothetical protein